MATVVILSFIFECQWLGIALVRLECDLHQVTSARAHADDFRSSIQFTDGAAQ